MSIGPQYIAGQYNPPGVYIQETPSPSVSVVGVEPTLAAIVGPGIGYRVITDTLVLSGTTPVSLSHEGVIAASIVVTDATGVTYVNVTDYTLTGSGSGPTSTETIARVSAGAIPNDDTVFVTYNYADTNYFTPVQTSDYNTIQAIYGPPFNPTTGEIVSPLTLAAQIAFMNGARDLVVLATPTETVARADLEAAYTTLLANAGVNIIVPLPLGITGTPSVPGDVISVATDLENALDTRGDNGLLTVGIIGYDTGVTVLPTVIATAVADARVVLAWPNQLNYYNGFTNSVMVLGGCYLAAAYAGILSSNTVQIPLTKKTVNGFAGIPASLLQTMTMAQKNTWSAGGVAVTEQTRGGALVVRHGVTTNTGSDITQREISLVRSNDSLVDLITQTVNSSALIGTPVTNQTVTLITGMMSGVLNTAQNAGIILGYSGLQVTQQVGDPTIMLVNFSYQPSYPLNYISITFAVDTQTGQTNVLTPAGTTTPGG